MSSYGRNFDFATLPDSRDRRSRFSLDSESDDLPIGAPVTADTSADETELGLRPVNLVSSETAPIVGESGILVYEHLFVDGLDPVTSTASDKDTAPAGKAVQVVSGAGIKVRFRNTEDRTFLNTRDYTGRTMVDELGPNATIGVSVGDLLTPGPGSDANGYWQSTTTADNAWLRVTKVDTDRGEVEAEMLF